MNKRISIANLEKVTNDIEGIVKRKSISYIEACIIYCEERDIEIEYIGEIITKNQKLKTKVQKEAEDLNFIKRVERLKFT